MVIRTYAPASIRWGIKRYFCLSRTSDVTREQRPRKTKIGTEAAHVTCDSDTTFKVERSRPPGCFTHHSVGVSGSCCGGHGNVLAMRNWHCCYVAVCSAARGASAPTGRRAGHIVAAARLQLVLVQCSFVVLVQNV